MTKRSIIFLFTSVVLFFAVNGTFGQVVPVGVSVTTTADSGPGSLRDAINQVNEWPRETFIRFSFYESGPQVIYLQSPLPAVGDNVAIYGLVKRIGQAPSKEVILDGSQMPDDPNLGELTLLHIAGNECTVHDLYFQNSKGAALGITGDHNSIEGCIFGVSFDGESSASNQTSNIYITGNYNTIGGVEAYQRNVISGAKNGVSLFPWSHDNKIIGNYIGTDITGNSAIPWEHDGISEETWNGISVGGYNNQVGGPNPGEGNLVSGNGQGILIMSWGPNEPAHSNLIQGNVVGLAVDGVTPLPNGMAISLAASSNNKVVDNIIAYNRYHGVYSDYVLSWDLIPTGNLIRANSIYSNGEMGINLGGDWVTPNDPGDTDTGPNNLMNFPVIESARTMEDDTIIKGTIDTQNPEAVTIDFYASSQPDQQTGYGEGEIYLGSTKVSKKGKFTAVFPPVAPGSYITATATDTENNTSEFSLAVQGWAPGLSKNTTELSASPQNFSLEQNYPNPFNPSTEIRFELPYPEHVRLDIYNALGEKIMTLADAVYETGVHKIVWNGQSTEGNTVSSGFYLCTIQAGTFSKSIKMIYLQ